MRKENVRVEARDLPYNPTREERERNFKNLMSAFRQACNKAGIMKAIKKQEFYESKAQITRRKKREKEATMLKVKMKESFFDAGARKDKPAKPKKREG